MREANVMPIDPSRARSDKLIKNLAGTLGRLTGQDWNALLELAEVRRHRFNDLILKQGFVGEALYVISEGEVRVEREDDEGRRTPLSRLGPGAVFGEMSFLDSSGASANVVADGAAEVLYLDGAAVRDLTERDPAFAARFYQSLAVTLSRRLRATNEVIRARS